MSVTRRQFLIGGAALAVSGGGAAAIVASASNGSHPAVTGPGSTSAPSASASSRPGGVTAGRVLVILQFSGGNDGLNTLVPVGASAATYHSLRPTLGVTQPVELPGTADFALHPSLQALVPLWTAGRLRPVAGVGFEHPSRSHFEAMRWWWNGTVGGTGSTGWLGRYFDATGGTTKQLRSVALGTNMPALYGIQSTPTVVLDPSNFALVSPRFADAGALIKAYGSLSASNAAALDAVDVFSAIEAKNKAAAKAATKSGGRREQITELLATAAELIAADVGSQTIVVTSGGFDTHAGQANAQDALLKDVGEGIAQFFAALDASGHADRVLLMTTSEFGRRAKENGSGGTDHGKASVHFMAGAGLSKGVAGAWDLAHLDDGDLPAVIDTRAYLANGITWLGGDAAAVFGSSVVPVPLLASV